MHQVEAAARNMWAVLARLPGHCAGTWHLAAAGCCAWMPDVALVAVALVVGTVEC